MDHVMPQLVTADGLEAYLTTAMAVTKKKDELNFFQKFKNQPGKKYDLIPDVLKQQLERPDADHSLFTLMMNYPNLVDFTQKSLKGTGDREYIMGYKEFLALLENTKFAEGKGFPEFAQFLLDRAYEIKNNLPKEEIAKMTAYAALAVMRGKEFNEELVKNLLSNPSLTIDSAEMVKILVTQLLAKNNTKGLQTVLYDSNIIEKMERLTVAEITELESILRTPMSNDARAVIVTSGLPGAHHLFDRDPSEFNFKIITDDQLINLFHKFKSSFIINEVFQVEAFSKIHGRLFAIMSDIQLETLVFEIFNASKDFSLSNKYNKFNEIILSVLNNEEARNRLKDTFGLLYRTSNNEHFKAVLKHYFSAFSPPTDNELQTTEFHRLASETL
jgi:hypothetical protein